MQLQVYDEVHRQTPHSQYAGYAMQRTLVPGEMQAVPFRVSQWGNPVVLQKAADEGDGDEAARVKTTAMRNINLFKVISSCIQHSVHVGCETGQAESG